MRTGGRSRIRLELGGKSGWLKIGSPSSQLRRGQPPRTGCTGLPPTHIPGEPSDRARHAVNYVAWSLLPEASKYVVPSESCSVTYNSFWPHGLYSCSVVSNSANPYSSWNPLGQNTRVDSLSLLQGTLPTQGSNCIAGRFFTSWATREAPKHGKNGK